LNEGSLDHLSEHVSPDLVLRSDPTVGSIYINQVDIRLLRRYQVQNGSDYNVGTLSSVSAVGRAD